MNDGQLLGDAVDAAITARAIEPSAGETAPGEMAGEGADGHTHESACLNCGTPLIGSHCHACGQAAHVHRTLGAFFHDLLHGVFHFEGKIWRTLPMLAWRPGELTRRYIDGQRARFVSPLALFLFSVFLLFAVYHQTAGEEHIDSGVEIAGTGDSARGEREATARLAALKARRADLAGKGQDTSAIDREIDNQAMTLDIIREVKATPGKPGKVSDIAAIDHAVKAFRENPGLVAYKAQSYAYKYSWALIPISVPFLWLLFPFSRRFHLYDHTVFVTYSLCFMTLLGALVMVLSALGQDWAVAALLVVPPLHMYRQLRGAYGCSRTGAALRAIALANFAFVALALFSILIVAQTGA